jgi:hypothetical protein
MTDFLWLNISRRNEGMVVMQIVRIVLAVILAGTGLAAIVNTPYDPSPWTPDEVRRRVDGLNERAAVTSVHGILASRAAHERHGALLNKVQKGVELTAVESAEYRDLYQAILADNQRLLGFLDWNLAILTDVGMARPNNIGGLGIEGAHDHHDASARSNFTDVLSALDAIRTASGPFSSMTRIKNAMSTYKNLTDIILHLGTAPQTKSVGYAPAEQTAQGPLPGAFEAHLQSFKRAQFEPVNSPAYVRHLHEALRGYDRLVLDVQDVVLRHLGPWERTFAGRWGSWQSFGTSVEGEVVRFPRGHAS